MAVYAGSYYRRVRKLAEAPTRQPPSTPTQPSPTKPLPPDIKWQTYFDPEALGISLEYPAAWAVREEEHYGKFAPAFVSPVGCDQPGQRCGELIISRRELSSWGPNTKLEETFALDEGVDSVKITDELIVGGERAVRRVAWEANYQGRFGEEGLVRKYVRLLHKDYVYKILYWEEAADEPLRSAKDWQLDPIFDHMLSTFRFLDQAENSSSEAPSSGGPLAIPTPQPIDFYTCTSASHDDCVRVDAGYCGCNEGGKATAINKKYVEKWQKQWQVEGEPMVFCSQVMSTDPTCTMVPRCIEKRCQLLEKGEFCGGFAGKSCPVGYHCVYDGHYPDAGGTCQKN